MKNIFSTAWKSSAQPRKQRKYLFNLPMHLQTKVLSIHLSKELRAKHATRAVRVRVGDKVRVLRGTHKGKEGKVDRVDVKNSKIYVAKVEHLKKEGGRAPYPLSPSNLLLVELVSDKRRFKDASKNTSKNSSVKSATKSAKPAEQAVKTGASPAKEE